ncbi:MAG: endonuclease/exonuclease/phosphatase family protein [Proteobacteria bacterium]|nr:endonuclease/exonuclease/phosphatase family protein [Pseudomonadota bacterium]
MLDRISSGRNASLILLSVLLVLVSCVSVGDKNQFISNASAVSHDLQSCEQASLTENQAKNLLKQNSQVLDPDNIAFLNWNIYKGNGENWQKDLSAFAKSHHVMTIQEALLDEELDVLLEQHGFGWTLNTAFYLNGEAAGVMNVASTSSVHSCGFKVDEPLIRIPKAALVSYYLMDGSDEKLLVANIHGINFTFGVSSYREQLDKLYDAIKHHDGPMIVAGDFNTWSDGRMDVLDQLVKRLELSRLEYSVNNKTHVFGNAIDHVFYRKLELVSNKVFQVASSDHNPISVNFRLSSKAF